MSAETKRQVNRYALLLIFEYQRVPGCVDAPNPLLSMHTDMHLAYKMCKERFNIPSGNITVVTDLRIRPKMMNPWDPLSGDASKNPRIVRLACPDIRKITRELAQFSENTIRGIRETVIPKGKDVTHEIFVYVSCHGAQIPNPRRHQDNSEEMDNAFIFTSSDGKTRKYLRDDHIFSILFGQMEVDGNGIMTVPVTNRKVKRDNKGDPYFDFIDENMSFQISSEVLDRYRQVSPDGIRTPNQIVGATPKGYHKYIKDRGLPSTAQMLFMVDSCHSGTIADFHYIYNAEKNKMMLTRNPPIGRASFPLCVCLSAACDEKEAPSTSNGSPFTRHLYQILNESSSVSIKELYRKIYKNLPELLSKCSPTITATVSDADLLVPLLTNPPKLPIPSLK